MKQVLINTILQRFPELSEEDSELIIDRLCKIHEPETPPLEPQFGYFEIDQNKNIKSSIKPGNVLLNMEKLIADSAEIGLTIAGVITTPYLIPLAALLIWNKVWSNIKVDLKEEHGVVIKIMWENRDENYKVKEKKIFELYNHYLKQKNRNKIVRTDFKHILIDLENMKCIEKSGKEIWWLRERVKK